MKLKVIIVGLAAIALLAAGCNSSNNSSQNTPDDQGTSQNTTGSNSSGGTSQSVGSGNSQGSEENSGAAESNGNRTVNMTLSQVNGSKEQGTATLEGSSTSTVVTLSLTGEPSGSSQPSHIHIGKCPNPGAVKYPLNNVVSGKSRTVLQIPLSTILESLPLAINVHKSSSQINTYMSCGDILAQ